MKITNEMVERAEAQWEHGSRDMRLALEAALADVPEIEAQWYEHKERADAAETKLAKVREWLDNMHWTVRGDDRTELQAILEKRLISAR